MSQKTLLCLSILFFFNACSTNDIAENNIIDLDISAPVIQQIYNLQTARKTRDLFPFLSSRAATQRYAAAMALGSIQDSSSLNPLVDLLDDKNEAVRYAAVYALGQLKMNAAAKFLTEAFQKDSSSMIKGAILESIGKCADESYLKYLCASRKYPSNDSLLINGLAASFYRFLCRDMYFEEGTDKMILEILSNVQSTKSARMFAAFYLARLKAVDLTKHQYKLFYAYDIEPDPYIKAALASAIVSCKGTVALEKIHSIHSENQDPIVQTSLLKNLFKQPFDSIKLIAYESLFHEALHVQKAAADLMYQSCSDAETAKLWSIAMDVESWQIKSRLMGACLKNTAYFKYNTLAAYNKKILDQYNKSTDPYVKSAYLNALKNQATNYSVFEKILFRAEKDDSIAPILYSTAAEGIVAFRRDIQENQSLSNYSVSKKILDGLIKKCIRHNDIAVKAIAGNLLQEKASSFKFAFKSFDFLKSAINELQLPEHVETYEILRQAYEDLSGLNLKSKYIAPDHFSNIDWTLLNTINDGYNIVINTNKGEIILELYPEAAPATVTQFVRLAKANYYNERLFHRVVSNFVIQGGCTRGDGWSGFKVTLPSEFHADYNYHDAGYIGMASAGKDTESAQFFITHGPTPHLDGKYTIFGKVRSGISVVNSIQPKDKIISVKIN